MLCIKMIDVFEHLNETCERDINVFCFIQLLCGVQWYGRLWAYSKGFYDLKMLATSISLPVPVYHSIPSWSKKYNVRNGFLEQVSLEYMFYLVDSPGDESLFVNMV